MFNFNQFIIERQNRLGGQIHVSGIPLAISEDRGSKNTHME